MFLINCATIGVFCHTATLPLVISNLSFSLTGVNVPKSRTYYMVYVFVMYFMRLVCFGWMGKLRHNQEIWS